MADMSLFHKLARKSTTRPIAVTATASTWRCLCLGVTARPCIIVGTFLSIGDQRTFLLKGDYYRVSFIDFKKSGWLAVAKPISNKCVLCFCCGESTVTAKNLSKTVCFQWIRYVLIQCIAL